jgi:hypothetical protein
MSACGASENAEALRINLPFLRMRAGETHGAIHIFEDVHDRVARLAAVHDCDDGVAPIDQGLGE